MCRRNFLKKIKVIMLMVVVAVVSCGNGGTWGQRNCFASSYNVDENREILTVNANNTGELPITAKSAILMEASTGKVLYEKEDASK